MLGNMVSFMIKEMVLHVVIQYNKISIIHYGQSNIQVWHGCRPKSQLILISIVVIVNYLQLLRSFSVSQNSNKHYFLGYTVSMLSQSSF